MPNQVSLISAAFTFTGIVLLATVPPSIVLGIIVWLLLAVGYAWDSADAVSYTHLTLPTTPYV